jgi:hypothetical protein
MEGSIVLAIHKNSSLFHLTEQKFGKGSFLIPTK